MSASWKSADVLCPFYCKDDRVTRSVTCEGLEDDSRIRLMYFELRARDGHMDRFCCRDYRLCPVYEMLMKKYD